MIHKVLALVGQSRHLYYLRYYHLPVFVIVVVVVAVMGTRVY